jgi:hypothetical protein
MKPQRSQRNTLCPENKRIKRQKHREAEGEGTEGRESQLFELAGNGSFLCVLCG